MPASHIYVAGYALGLISILAFAIGLGLLIRKLTESESRLDLHDRVGSLESLIDDMSIEISGLFGAIRKLNRGSGADRSAEDDEIGGCPPGCSCTDGCEPDEGDDFADLVNVVGRAKAQAAINERARVNFGQTQPHIPYDDID